MVAIAVLAIISAIAIPAYNNYVVRGKLSEAFSMLGDYRLRMEQFYQDNRNYADATNTGCGAALPTAAKYFSFSCTLGASGAQYTVTAASKGNVGLRNAGDYTYTIDQAGIPSTPKFAGAPGPSGTWQSK